MKKFLLTALTFILLIGCSTLKGRDVDYSNGKATQEQINDVFTQHKDSVVAILSTSTDRAVGSGVCIGYNQIDNETYVVTAQHVMKLGVRKVLNTELNQSFDITTMFRHPTKDMGVLVIKGRLPFTNVYTGKPLSDYDIIIGYIDGEFNKKLPLAGRAVPGQSGGGVFSNKVGFFATVSTTGDAVETWTALQEMKKTNLIGLTVSTNAK